MNVPKDNGLRIKLARPYLYDFEHEYYLVLYRKSVTPNRLKFATTSDDFMPHDFDIISYIVDNSLIDYDYYELWSDSIRSRLEYVARSNRAEDTIAETLVEYEDKLVGLGRLICSKYPSVQTYLESTFKKDIDNNILIEFCSNLGLVPIARDSDYIVECLHGVDSNRDVEEIVLDINRIKEELETYKEEENYIEYIPEYSQYIYNN